jgi:mRNA interferase MazF
VKRGEIWTGAGGKDYAGKARPVVIVQSNNIATNDSITICGLTTDPTNASIFRLPIKPNEANGLRMPCRLMVDKITTVPRSKLGARIGSLSDLEMLRVNRAMVVFLGIAG